jgi:hypothetical protein
MLGVCRDRARTVLSLICGRFLIRKLGRKPAKIVSSVGRDLIYDSNFRAGIIFLAGIEVSFRRHGVHMCKSSCSDK